MTLQRLSGTVQTVLGTFNPGDLGATLSHEHVLWDASFLFDEPEEKKLGHMSVSIENLDWLKRNGNGNIDNLKQVNEEIAVQELTRFKQAGGGTVVDMSNIGLCRDPEGLARVSHLTGVNIIMGTGYYVGASHPKGMVNRSVDDLVEEMVKELTIGVGDTGIKAGVIGEIGCSYPLQDTELKVLEAVAETQRKTGAPVNIHPGRSQSMPMELIELFHNFGGDLNHTSVSHISNRHGLDLDLTVELAKTGCYIEYDSFGNYLNPLMLPEKTFYALTDWQRIECIKDLIREGFLDRILLSHDVFHKTDLRKYGGYGYDHIHRTVIPYMKMIDLSDSMIYSMLVENPSRFLTFQ